MALGKVSMYLPVLAGLLGNWSLFYDASSWGHDWFNCNWFGHAGSALKSICYIHYQMDNHMSGPNVIYGYKMNYIFHPLGRGVIFRNMFSLKVSDRGGT